MLSLVSAETCYSVVAQSTFVQTALWEPSLFAEGGVSSITLSLKKAIKGKVCPKILCRLSSIGKAKLSLYIYTLPSVNFHLLLQGQNTIYKICSLLLKCSTYLKHFEFPY